MIVIHNTFIDNKKKCSVQHVGFDHERAKDRVRFCLLDGMVGEDLQINNSS